MTRPYSLDLRERVARFDTGGGSCHAAAAHFGVSVSFVVKLMATLDATDNLAAKPQGGWRYSKVNPHRAFLVRRVAKQDDITMPELTAELAARGTVVAPSSISRWLIRNDCRFKKTLLTSEQDRPDVAAARQAWMSRQPRVRLAATPDRHDQRIGDQLSGHGRTH